MQRFSGGQVWMPPSPPFRDVEALVSGENLLKPRLAAEPIRHQRFEQFVEFWTVIWMHNVHELVGDHVVDARDRGAYQIR